MALHLDDTWIWDSWYAEDGDTYHAFYLAADRSLGDPDLRHFHPRVGHATSADLTNWTVQPDALAPSAGPAFDSATTWTGSVVRDMDGTWWMFYTGGSRDEDGLVQRIGAATSPDLFTWTKFSSSAMVEADPAHYETLGTSSWSDQAWRDPFVFRREEEPGWHMLVTARANHGDVDERGVVGYATSQNLTSWTVQPPLSEPGQGFGQLEVMQYEVVDSVPLLVFCSGKLSQERIAAGEVEGMFSLPVGAGVTDVDLRRARLFERTDIYAAHVIAGPDGRWNLIGFINRVDGKFVGELCDPVPVTADPVRGLVAR